MSVFITLNSIFQAGSITYKNASARNIPIRWNAPAGAGAVWNGFLQINTVVAGVGIANLQLHTTGPGGVVGVEVNWPAGLNIPFVVTDQGPAPGPPLAPVVQNWIHAGAVPGPVMNMIIHANEYQIAAVAGFHMMNGAQPFATLLILNQLQSALWFF